MLRQVAVTFPLARYDVLHVALHIYKRLQSGARVNRTGSYSYRFVYVVLFYCYVVVFYFKIPPRLYIVIVMQTAVLENRKFRRSLQPPLIAVPSTVPRVLRVQQR